MQSPVHGYASIERFKTLIDLPKLMTLKHYRCQTNVKKTKLEKDLKF